MGEHLVVVAIFSTCFTAIVFRVVFCSFSPVQLTVFVVQRACS